MYVYLFYKLIFLCQYFFSISLILLSSLLDSSLANALSGIISSFLISSLLLLDFQVFNASTCFFSRSSIVFTCLSKALPKGEYVNFVCPIIC